jgi:hypothetical protein
LSAGAEPAKSLLGVRTYQLEPVFGKPIDDLTPLDKLAGDGLYSFLYGHIQSGVTELRNSGILGYSDQADALDRFFNMGSGKAAFKTQSRVWVMTLREYIQKGYHDADKTAIDFTDLRSYGPGRGIPASDLGAPTFKIEPTYRLRSVKDFYKYAVGGPGQWLNINMLVEDFGMQWKYKPNRTIEATAAFRIEMGVHPWTLRNDSEQVQIGLNIHNHHGVVFGPTLKLDYINATKRFDTFIGLSLNLSF